MMITSHHLYPLLVLMVISGHHNLVNGIQLEDYGIEPSYFEDSPCPNAEDIAPCTCVSIMGEPLEINCTGIADEQQLYDIFHGDFPVKLFDILYLETYLFDTLSNDVFGDVMFKIVKTPDYGNGLLASVGNETFLHMSSELIILSLGYNNIVDFPFDTIPLFTKLTYLSLRESPLQIFPKLQSESLRILDLSHGMYDTIPEGAFDGMPNLQELYISSYIPLSITKDVFTSLNVLRRIEILFTPGMEHITSYEFETNTTELANLRLTYNWIETVDIDAFKGIQASTSHPNGTKIDLTDNELTILPEDVWRPILDVGVKLDLNGNPLECGCDMAWLVLEPSYHPLVALWCNGADLPDMDPSWYEDNC